MLFPKDGTKMREDKHQRVSSAFHTLVQKSFPTPVLCNYLRLTRIERKSYLSADLFPLKLDSVSCDRLNGFTCNKGRFLEDVSKNTTLRPVPKLALKKRIARNAESTHLLSAYKSPTPFPGNIRLQRDPHSPQTAP